MLANTGDPTDNPAQGVSEIAEVLLNGPGQCLEETWKSCKRSTPGRVKA